MHTDQGAFTLRLVEFLQVFEWINTAVSGQGVLIWGPEDWFDREKRCERNGGKKNMWKCTEQGFTPTQNRSQATKAVLYFFIFCIISYMLNSSGFESVTWGVGWEGLWAGVWGGKLWKIDECGRKHSPVSCSGHQNYTHGVGVTGSWAPASQDNDDISLSEEASGFAWKININN